MSFNSSGILCYWVANYSKGLHLILILMLTQIFCYSYDGCSDHEFCDVFY